MTSNVFLALWTLSKDHANHPVLYEALTAAANVARDRTAIGTAAALRDLRDELTHGWDRVQHTPDELRASAGV